MRRLAWLLLLACGCHYDSLFALHVTYNGADGTVEKEWVFNGKAKSPASQPVGVQGVHPDVSGGDSWPFMETR